MAEKNSKRPQSEPEIIPPGKQPDSGVWRSETMRGTHHIYVRRLGPVEIILWVVLIGAILAIGVAARSRAARTGERLAGMFG